MAKMSVVMSSKKLEQFQRYERQLAARKASRQKDMHRRHKHGSHDHKARRSRHCSESESFEAKSDQDQDSECGSDSSSDESLAPKEPSGTLYTRIQTHNKSSKQERKSTLVSCRD